MSLPKHFINPKEYFEESLKFFDDYKYLYNTPNVDVLIHDIFDKIQVNPDDINVFEEGINLTAIDDEFFKIFFAKLRRLQVDFENIHLKDLECNIDVPVSPKKKHEILYLAKEIKDLCEDIGCDVVVDFGSGLGYLDQHIFETTQLKVLGIECNDSHYVGAKKRQRKYHENSIENVKYINHTITSNSHEKIQGFLHEKFQNHRDFCITGLHACADLTIDAINIFLNMDDAKAIAIMPCCYHKMEGENGVFKNFPLSASLRDVFSNFKGEEYMKVPFLRLAAQPPNVDEDLETLVFNLLSRAVLQLYSQKHNCKLKRNKRKAVRIKAMKNNFDTYIQDAATNGFRLIENEPLYIENKDDNTTFNREELKTLWNNITSVTLKKAGIYILLQKFLQPVIENFVLFDRLLYLQENYIKNVRFKKILNEKTSPRCLALIAYK